LTKSKINHSNGLSKAPVLPWSDTLCFKVGASELSQCTTLRTGMGPWPVAAHKDNAKTQNPGSPDAHEELRYIISLEG
jgi:hypothetical protein